MSRLHNVLLHINTLIHGLGMAFGLTTFYYCRRHKSFVDSKVLSRYCKFMGLLFFVLYPTAVLTLLVEFENELNGVTDMARNSVYVGSWLLCTLIFVNQTAYSTASCNVYNRAGALYIAMTKNQYERDIDSLNFAAKCVLKTCVLAIGFLAVNIAKYYYRVKTLSALETVLFIYLFLPSFIILLASNRFYVATTFCMYLIMKTNSRIKAVEEGYRGIIAMGKVSVFARTLPKMAAERIDELAANHTKLHQLFIDFHDMYAKYIVLILGFCFINVVFEVDRNLSFSRGWFCKLWNGGKIVCGKLGCCGFRK